MFQSGKSIELFLLYCIHCFFAAVEGEILTITTFTDNNVVKVTATSNNSGNRRNGADTLLYFELTDEILNGEFSFFSRLIIFLKEIT